MLPIVISGLYLCCRPLPVLVTDYSAPHGAIPVDNFLNEPYVTLYLSALYPTTTRLTVQLQSQLASKSVCHPFGDGLLAVDNELDVSVSPLDCSTRAAEIRSPPVHFHPPDVTSSRNTTWMPWLSKYFTNCSRVTLPVYSSTRRTGKLASCFLSYMPFRPRSTIVEARLI